MNRYRNLPFSHSISFPLIGSRSAASRPGQNRHTNLKGVNQFLSRTMVSPSMTSITTTTISQARASAGDVELSTAAGYDDEQIRLMEEVCIVIDENDQPLRPGTKKECKPPNPFRVLAGVLSSSSVSRMLFTFCVCLWLNVRFDC